MNLVALFSSIIVLLALVVLCAAVLVVSVRKFPVEHRSNIDQINALLPQTQCGQCGHPGCKPYAESIAAGGAINRCPPGGAATIARLASFMGMEVTPLDPTHGVEKPRTVAWIREDECIGCTKCIQACPVDAILGSAQHMHTVIVSECTGCDLCVDPCPVDCIDMIPARTPLQSWHWTRPDTRLASARLITSDQGHGANA